MRRLFPILALCLASLLLAAPVAAQEGYSFKSTQTGTAAQAAWSSCMPDTPEPGLATCEYTFVNVFEGTSRSNSDVEGPTRGGTAACVDYQTVIEGPDFGEVVSWRSGCTDDFTFTAAPDLSTAQLVATIPVFEMECTEFTCEPVGDPSDVAVDVTWDLDPAQTVRESGTFRYLDPSGLWCKSQFSRRGLAAFGTATGTVGGVDLGPADFAEIFSGTAKHSDSCR